MDGKVEFVTTFRLPMAESTCRGWKLSDAKMERPMVAFSEESTGNPSRGMMEVADGSK